MANLLDTAQIIKDLYYQNDTTDEDFFTLDHFVYLSGVAYSKVLEDEYKEARALAKLEEGFAEIFLADDWLVEETLDMKPLPDGVGGYYGELKKPLFSFPYDPFSFGIQSVRRAGASTCSQFVRTSERDTWLDCQLPQTGRSYFFQSARRLIVKNSRCKLDKLKILMVPEITDESFGESGGPVPKSKEDMIIRKTLEIMFKAREGVVVDMSNNSNPNKSIQTEVDTMFSNLRTKPI